MVESGNLHFALNLYKILGKSEKNVFFSPYSISSAMSMVLAGSRNETAKELKEALGYLDLTDAELDDANLNITQKINASKESIILETANKLFPDASFTLRQEFVKKCKEYFEADITTLDFNGDADNSRSEINQWVERQTRNKIKDLMPPGSVNSSTKMILANAVYFKGDWVFKFDKMQTKQKVFHTGLFKYCKVSMMYALECYGHRTDKKLKAEILELPYKGEAVSMLIVLPFERFGLLKVAKKLTPEYVLGLINEINSENFIQRWIKVQVPKMLLECSLDLDSGLKQMGIKEAFSESADFGNISNEKNLFLSAVSHKAFIEVNEEGSEATAATRVPCLKGASCCWSPPKKPKFICDHPFLFFIVHKPTNTVLFMGRFASKSE